MHFPPHPNSESDDFLVYRRPHKLKDSYNYKILNLNKVQIELPHEYVCLEYQKARIERSWKLILICTSHFMRLIPTDRYLMKKYMSIIRFFL